MCMLVRDSECDVTSHLISAALKLCSTAACRCVHCYYPRHVRALPDPSPGGLLLTPHP